MAYIEFAELKGGLTKEDLVKALDDDHDGVIDAWDEVLAEACEQVDSLLEPKFRVPLTLSPMPRIIKSAVRAFIFELCYRRRETPDHLNPWKSRADAHRETLRMIATGKLQLSVEPAAPEPFDAGTLESWESKLGAPGRMLG